MPTDINVPIRVLHSLDIYLRPTQNWIYPQIAYVPQTETAVLCQRVDNLSEFPVVGRPIFLQGGGFLVRARQLALSRAGAVGSIADVRAWRWRPSIIHAHFGTRGWRSLPLKKLLRVPLITSFYGFEAWSLPVALPVWRDRFARLFRQGDLFLVEGPAMRRRMVEIGCPPEKLRIGRLGVDSANMPFAKPDFRKGLKIAMVGRFVEKKGLVDGLRACMQAARAGMQLEVTIVGDASPDDKKGQAIKQELLSLSRSSELLGRVHLSGFLTPPQVRSTLARQNVLLCPSKHSSDGDAEGGMPFVLAEAMAMGLIGIGSRHCDMPELIIDGRTGFLFDEGNIEQLADLLKRISCSTVSLPSIADTARKYVEENFNLLQQLTALGKIYREIASGRPNAMTAE